MRIIGFLLAVLVGLLLWGITLAFSGGVAPLGKTGGVEGAAFFTPILVFATPLAVAAFLRGHALTGTCLFAVAPIFGFLNFALVASARTADLSSLGLYLSKPFAPLLMWLVLLAVVLAAATLFGRLLAHPSSAA